MQYHNVCPLCGSAKIIDLRRYSKDFLCKCNACSFKFSRKIPEKHELAEYYSEYSYGKEYFVSPITVKRYKEILNKLEPFRMNNVIVDIGCGIGSFLNVAKEMGWECYGTEYSLKAVELCCNAGLNVYHGSFSEVKDKIPQSDIVLLIEVIEHLSSPVELIKDISQKLRQGGALYLTTPNFNSLSRYISKEKYSELAYPEHLSYFTSGTIKKICKNNGLRPLKIETTGISISRLQSAITSKKENPFQSGSKDEKLRESMEFNPVMSFVKRLLNWTLNLTKLGNSLKGTFVKA
ncbi:MAG: class I SAM-dependent methyltransferase [Bacteroidetes bacterium]|nr:class I SAM-dependent methyltransferase [Bacteroidota bacterium]